MDNVGSGFLVVSRDGPPPIQELMGPFFLGLVINYFLWGIQVTQSYYYYKSYRNTDNIWFKLTVGSLFIMDIVQTICASETGWSFMVDKWGNAPQVLTTFDWGISLMPFMDTFTASIVHFFYAYKIWIMLSTPYNYIWTALVVSLSLTQLAAGIGGVIVQFSIQMTVSTFDLLKVWVSIWLVTASVTDIIITAVMTWKLSRSRTGFQETDDIISKLIRLVVETGLAPAVVQIVDVVIYLIWPLKPFHTLPTLITPKVYSNSVLAVLNSRPVRKPIGQWESQAHKLSSSVSANHTHTISIHRDYELHERKLEHSRGLSRSDGSPSNDLESVLPFSHK